MNQKIKKLDRMFNPKNIAVIGASNQINSVGWGLMENILKSAKKRKIFAINPYKKEILGIKCISSIGSVLESIDLAIIAVPAKIVPNIVKECCEKKVGGIIIISAGFAEKDREGKELQDKVAKIVKKANVPLLGPNCLGIIRPSVDLNASFAPGLPKKGEIAFVSQSGALIDSVIDRNLLEYYGFSTIISYGNEADLDLNDFLKFLKNDKETKVIVLYLEGIKDGRKFINTAKEVSKVKPILVLKAGKTKAGQRAALTHTASLSGSAEIYSAAFKQAGIIELDSVEELFNVSKALAWQPKCKNGIGIITNGGGCGVLATDYCDKSKINLPRLSRDTIQKLDKPNLMHPAYSKRNPLDIVGDALSSRYKAGIEALLEQKNIYGLLVIQTLQIMTEVEENAKIIKELKRKYPKKPIICCFMGGKYTNQGIEILEKNHIPNYLEPQRAVLAIRSLIKK
ncbi:MAG: CoA-binding protein [Patescibacteria group bacterium]|nr:CoA-binding protein [Patescibacteria group bacterium]